MSKAKKKIDLSKKVMKEIHQKQVKMRPRAHFLVGSILLGIGLAGALILATFFINLAIFRLRVHGPLGYLGFGRFGLRPFLATFPWLLFLVAVGGLFGGLALLRRYDISYKKSFLGLAISLLVLILTAGFLLDFLGFNERARGLKPLGPLFPEQFAGEDWVVGEILEAKNGELVIVTPRGEEVTIKMDEKTLLPFGKDFAVGERIRAIGEWQQGSFMAKGIGKGGLHWRMKEPVKGIRDNRLPPRRF